MPNSWDAVGEPQRRQLGPVTSGVWSAFICSFFEQCG